MSIFLHCFYCDVEQSVEYALWWYLGHPWYQVALVSGSVKLLLSDKTV